MRVRLRESIPVKLTTGAGFARLGPQSAREIWYPTNVHIKCSTKVLESRCSIFVGNDTSQGNFRDESVLGSSGDSSGAISADVVTTGEYIWAVWSGADANTIATLTVTGTKNV